MGKWVATTWFIFTSLMATAPHGDSAEPKWGTVTGQVRLVGDLPKLKPLIKGAIQAPDERLVVHPATRGIANVAIYLAKKPSVIHPSLEKSAVETLRFTQKGHQFAPHVMFARTDQEIQFVCKDPGRHNVKSWPVKNVPINIMIAENDEKVVTQFARAEKLPVKVTSDIAPWMIAYWLVLDHPYAAVTDAEGNFEITNLPIGTHDIIIWQESAGYLEKKCTVEVIEGLNELDPLEYDVGQFLK